MFSEKIELQLDSCAELLEFIQQIGESNALLSAREGVFKDLLYGTMAIYNSLFKANNDNTKVKASFEVLHFAGWKYEENQRRRRKVKQIEFEELKKELYEKNKD